MLNSHCRRRPRSRAMSSTQSDRKPSLSGMDTAIPISPIVAKQVRWEKPPKPRRTILSDLKGYIYTDNIDKFAADLESLDFNRIFTSNTLYDVLIAAYECYSCKNRSLFTSKLYEYGSIELRRSLLFLAVKKLEPTDGEDGDTIESRNRNSCSIVEEILERAPDLATATGNAKRNLFHEAARLGIKSVIEQLILALRKSKDFSIAEETVREILSVEDNQKETPLSLAVQKNHVGVVGMLLPYEARKPVLVKLLQLATKTKQQATFETILASRSDLLTNEVMATIIAKGAEVIWKQVFGCYPEVCLGMDGILHSAVEWGQYDMVRDIVAHKPQLVEELDGAKQSVFHYIRQRRAGNEEVHNRIRKLLVPVIIRSNAVPMDTIRTYLMDSKGIYTSNRIS